jgi:acyl carrier protein
MNVLEIIMDIEEEFNLKLPDEEIIVVLSGATLGKVVLFGIHRTS